jgi:predicted RNA binding protein YcfA (HicA-like mRNA interferase family)
LKLKEDIPRLTKKRFVAALSKLGEKTKRVSNKLFHDIFDVLKKEMIKELLHRGWTQAPDAMNQIERWIHLLQ